MKTAIPLALVMLALSACGGGGNQMSADAAAEQLENAAAQSDPAARGAMLNAADAIRNGGADVNMSDPNSPVQQAMNAAGDAQAQTAGNAAADTSFVSEGGTAGGQAPPARNAKPHAPGDPVPPPKVNTGNR